MEVAEKKKGLSGSTLKIIAIIAMLIDHIGAALLGRMLIVTGYMEIVAYNDAERMAGWLQEHAALFICYLLSRMIGRIAFPIFCFLLVEGFTKTHNAMKYALRLGAFALIAEVPFDLAFNAQVLEFGYQNVFFTLFLGFVTMMVMDKIGRTEWNGFVKVLADIPVVVAGAGLAELLATDYSALGVICIVVLYIFRNKKVMQIIAGCISFIWELPALLGFIPMAFYNGERGLKLKYFFYIFYPLHLLLIYLVCVAMGIHGYAVV